MGAVFSFGLCGFLKVRYTLPGKLHKLSFFIADLLSEALQQII